MKIIGLVIFLLALSFFSVSGDTLTTIDKKEYKGKMVAFKYNTIYFNVYKLGEYSEQKRFPLYKVWKIEFNNPSNDKLETSYEMESNYKKLRRGKRTQKFSLNANEHWLDTGIRIKIGQDIMFSASGSIFIKDQVKVFQNGELSLDWNNKKPLPNQPTGAIIAKIGKKGKPFYVGDDKAPFHMSKKGKLYIGINDFYFDDNSGKFTVTIYY